jgi:Ca2+-transporting ATPase
LIQVLLSIAAVVSLAVGIFRPAQVPGEPQVYWVEGVAIMVAILIVVSLLYVSFYYITNVLQVVVGPVNDWQKERQFQTLNDKKEEKTDTLTQNVMTVVAGSVGIHAKFVRHLESDALTNAIAEEAGVRKHSNDFSLNQSQLNSALSPQLQELFNEAIAVNSTAFQAKDSDTGELIFVGSKIETALLQFAQDLKWPDCRTTRDSATVLQMIPFSSERKALGVVVKRSDGIFRLFLTGASEILSKKCVAHVVVHKEGDGIESATAEIETAAIDELANDSITRTTIFYANQMLRIIALCYRDFDSWPPRDVMPDEQNEVTHIITLT